MQSQSLLRPCVRHDPQSDRTRRWLTLASNDGALGVSFENYTRPCSSHGISVSRATQKCHRALVLMSQDGGPSWNHGSGLKYSF